MAVATIAINFSTVNQVLQGTSTNTSINPAVLRTAFQTSPSTLFLSLPSLTATYFGDGSNLIGTLVKSVSGVESYLGPSTRVSTPPDTRVASVSVVPPFAPPWHIGKTGKPLYQETGANRMSMSYVLSAEIMRYMQYITSANAPISSSAYSFTIPANGAGFDPVSNSYAQATLLLDGRIFCLPYSTTKARIYDPRFNNLTTPSPTFPLDLHTMCVMADGNILVSGFGATIDFYVIYNPATDTLTTPAGIRYSPRGINGMTLLPDGRVFCAAYGSTTHPSVNRIYDPVTNTLTTPPVASPGLYDYNGCVTMYDGRVYCVPDSTTCALIYNPYTNTFTTPNGVFPAGDSPATTSWNMHSGGTVMADGRIFLPPLSYSTPRIYDPQTDTHSTPTWDGSLNYGKGTLLPDGRVFCWRYVTTGGLNSGHRIYDPKTNTLEGLRSSNPDIQAYHGACFPNPNGTMGLFTPPYAAVTTGIINNFYANKNFSFSIYTNPTFRGNTG